MTGDQASSGGYLTPRDIDFRHVPYGENDALTVLGIPVVTSPLMPDGTIALINTHTLPPARRLVVGVEQVPEHRAEAIRIVREGLRDVLEWLGEPVEALTAGERVMFRLTAG